MFFFIYFFVLYFLFLFYLNTEIRVMDYIVFKSGLGTNDFGSVLQYWHCSMDNNFKIYRSMWLNVISQFLPVSMCTRRDASLCDDEFHLFLWLFTCRNMWTSSREPKPNVLSTVQIERWTFSLLKWSVDHERLQSPGWRMKSKCPTWDL